MARIEPVKRPSKYDQFVKALDEEANKNPDPNTWWLKFPGQGETVQPK